ncbi:hypothetical protein PUNSTDRAFT_53868, partial [Punctularia strigosozonata HHB-11173 SS5]|uniref:uncharacterized protein n=1 Tax=Punctularia strigosozonata (strain HHB-11173) TaxID=741275 RepID=UPI0004417B0E
MKCTIRGHDAQGQPCQAQKRTYRSDDIRAAEDPDSDGKECLASAPYHRGKSSVDFQRPHPGRQDLGFEV